METDRLKDTHLMNHEKGLHERTLLIGCQKSILREELLQKAKDTVDIFLADMDAKMTHKNENLYLHCNLLIRRTVDTKLEEFIKTVHAMEADIASAYEIFENKCQPILDRTLPIPIAIRERSTELLHEYDDKSDQYNKETTTVFKYEQQIGRAVSAMLANQDPEIVRTTLNFEGASLVEYGIDFCLDFERDTKEEVMNIVNLYPEALDDDDDKPPQVTNIISLRSVPFIPSVLTLWMKHCNRKLMRDDDFLRRFDHYCHRIITNINDVRFNNPVNDTNRFFDQQCANVLQWFIDKRSTFEDPPVFAVGGLHWHVNSLIQKNTFDSGSFFERRLQVLVNLCSVELELLDGIEHPLCIAAKCSPIGQYECFISILMAGINALTKNDGILLLFRYITPFSITPFAKFINRWPNKKEEKKKRFDAIDTALNDPILCRRHPPYDTAQAIFEAASSNQISLDGVFFFLRREPDVLQKSLLRDIDSTNDNNRTTDNTNRTTKRNSTAAPNNTSTNAGRISTKKTKTK